MMTQISIGLATGMRKYDLRILRPRVWRGLQPASMLAMAHELRLSRLGLQFRRNKVGINRRIIEFVEIDRCCNALSSSAWPSCSSALPVSRARKPIRAAYGLWGVGGKEGVGPAAGRCARTLRKPN